MINLHDLKTGDIIQAEFGGTLSEGEVIGIDREEKKANIQTSVQDFWFDSKDLYAVPLDESQLIKFSFEKQDQPDGSVKYMRGPFRILLSEKGNFSHFEMWYREDHRHIVHSLSVHELQNHFHDMTKVDLVRMPDVQPH